MVVWGVVMLAVVVAFLLMAAFRVPGENRRAAAARLTAEERRFRNLELVHNISTADLMALKQRFENGHDPANRTMDRFHHLLPAESVEAEMLVVEELRRRGTG